MAGDCGCGEQLRGPDVHAGIAWVGRRLRSVVYTVVDGDDAIVEGCIIIGSAKEIEERTKGLTRETFGITVNDPKYLWHKKRVPYRIAADLPDPQRVKDAIAHWEQHTSLRFVPWTPQEQAIYPDFVTFRTGSGCASAVGCQRGEQFIKLAQGCLKGNVIHEIGHAVGMFHEQSRSDRDQFIDVRLANIDPLYRHNFNQEIRDGKDVGSYDYGSIMHYPGNAFSLNGQPTIVARNGAVIGQRDGLSAGDIATFEALYTGVT